MGYRTFYNLETDDNLLDTHEKAIILLSKHTACFEDEVKWYTCFEDMKKYSKLHPDVLFTLFGDGEESGDSWVAYIRNGTEQYCPAKITYDKFDATKLV